MFNIKWIKKVSFKIKLIINISKIKLKIIDIIIIIIYFQEDSKKGSLIYKINSKFLCLIM